MTTTWGEELRKPSTLQRGAELAALILAECERAGAVGGSKLPTERRLAAELGVSRAAIRQALSFLEANGRVSREVGRGTFLREDGSDKWDGEEIDAAARADDLGPADVMAARELFEPQVLPLVVAHASARDFEDLDRCLRGGDAADTAETWEWWDAAFHRSVVAATHNQLLLRMYTSIAAARHGPLWGNLKLSHDLRDRRTFYRQDHREIVNALKARELERARAAMVTHLARVRADLLG